MAKSSGLKNAPSGTGKPSGGNRGNNPPAKAASVGNNSGSNKPKK